MGRPMEQGSAEPEAPAGGPPVRLPDLCGDFQMRIDRNGTWYYRGSPIGRAALVKLFSTVLRKDADGGHWLTTPVENGRIEVEDSHFGAGTVELPHNGRTDARRTASDHHRLACELRHDVSCFRDFGPSGAASDGFCTIEQYLTENNLY